MASGWEVWNIRRAFGSTKSFKYEEDGFTGGCEECSRFCIDCDGSSCIEQRPLTEEELKALQERINNDKCPFNF